MRVLGVGSLLLFVAACHWSRYDQKADSPTSTCRLCCQQAQDACKLDSDHPGYYCPRDYSECTAACDVGNENQICVIQTKRQTASAAPAGQPAATAAGTAATAPPVAVAKAASAAHGECDNKGTWQLTISDAKGRSASCTALVDVPRQVNFRIERRRDDYALRDLVPAPGWSDGFTIANSSDACGVTLTRDNASDAERPRRMTVTMTEKDGQVFGTFHYREELLRPAACELDATVVGALIAPAPAAAPPQQAPLPPPRPQPADQLRRGGGSTR